MDKEEQKSKQSQIALSKSTEQHIDLTENKYNILLVRD